jgi:hypothetical protein
MEYVPIEEGLVDDMTFKKYSSLFYDYDVVMYPSSVEVKSIESFSEGLEVGIVKDPWNLNFGSIPVTSSSIRYIEMANIGNKEVRVRFRVYGNISPFVTFSERAVKLNKNETSKVKVTFNSNGAEPGNYTGRIDRIVKIPKIRLFK